MKDFFVRLTTFLAIVTVLLGISVQAQSDTFGVLDTVYLDSISATPGQSVSVRVQARTDEAISSVSIPLVYNSSFLRLTDISFAGSRVEHISTRLVTPSLTSSISGHFVVAVIKIAELPMAPGSGTVFTLKFTVNDTARIGQVFSIDTMFYSPGGEMIMVENSSSSIVRPAFRAGKIVITGANHPPTIASVPTQSVSEGDSLKLTALATDPDQQTVTLKMISSPPGMIFSSTGNGSGTLAWSPEFVGPNSADGSPFKIILQASDGMTSVEKEVQVQVLNTNRAPVITAPSSLSIKAGQPLNFTVAASEPDFESLTWTCVGIPDGATFAHTAPYQFTWTPPITAFGTANVTFIARDQVGAADTVSTALSVEAVEIYSLRLDTISGALGDFVTVTVALKNELPITGYNLLINYDPTGLIFQSAAKTGTRSEPFSSFTVTPEQTRVRIVGKASATEVGTPIAPGTGSLVTLRFKITNDFQFAGYSIPVDFAFLDVTTLNDNTLTSEAGAKIPQTEIAYANGTVKIREVGTVLIGDINLNNVAFDISDIVYFTNFFISSARYPFNLLQYANSDINGDNLLATVADLVRMITIIINGEGFGKISVEQGLTGQFIASHGASATSLGYTAARPLGALLMELHGSADGDIELSLLQPQMTMNYLRTDSIVRVLVYSPTGAAMESGAQNILSITGDWSVTDVQAATDQGSMVAMSLSNEARLPDAYSLGQNYPNPFNPETRISFALPHGGRVQLEVFDVLGRKVTTLADGDYPAGEHAVTWNGRDRSGTMTASGVYFYRLLTEDGTFSKKMMLLK